MKTMPASLVLSVGVVLCFLSVPTAAQQPAPAGPPQPTPEAPMPSVPLPPDLDRVLRDYERAWRARDAAGLAALFTEDGFVLPGGRPPVRGRAAIERYYTGHGGDLSLRGLAFSTGDRVGYIIGAYGAAPGSPDTGKFVLALRRAADGRWMIAADMDNSNQRPRPPIGLVTPAPPAP